MFALNQNVVVLVSMHTHFKTIGVHPMGTFPLFAIFVDDGVAGVVKKIGVIAAFFGDEVAMKFSEHFGFDCRVFVFKGNGEQGFIFRKF